MALEDYLEPEVGIAIAVTAAVASPKVRGVLRQGAVYGLAGLLKAGDAVSSAARGFQRGVQPTDEAPAESASDAALTVPADRAAATTADAETEAAPRRTRKSAEGTAHE